MNATVTKTIENVSLNGPIRLSVAIAFAILVVVFLGWALRRESRILGPRHTVLFWMLRSIAVVTVVWMLLAPVNVRIETSTTRRAVAVLTDVSASMQTVDAVGTSDDLRWAVASSRDTPNTATRDTDRSSAAIQIAQRHLASAVESLKQRKPESAVLESTGAASDAIRRGVDHLEKVASLAESRQDFQDSVGKIKKLLQILSDAEFESFHQLCESLRNGRTPSQRGWREALPDLQHRLAGIDRVIAELAREIKSQESQYLIRTTPGTLSGAASESRLAKATRLIHRWHDDSLRDLATKVDIQFSSFDNSVRRLADQNDPANALANLSKKTFSSPKHSQPTTRADESEEQINPAATSLSSVLQQLGRWQQQQPIAAAFLLTDVGHNDVTADNPRRIASTLDGVPVFVVPIGNPDHVRDVILQDVSSPSVAMRNDEIVIEASVQAYDCKGETVTVQLLRDGEVIDFREVRLDSDFANRKARFEQRMPEIGIEKFQVAVQGVRGELTTENNFDEFDVNVTRSEIKVLIADESPRWEYRYLAQLFRRDDKVDCDELLFHPRMVATGHRAATETVPVGVDDWDRYDVVILGDLAVEHMPVAAQESLIEYLSRRGGTIVIIAGSESMPANFTNHPLESILPVQPISESDDTSGGFSFRVTDLGRDHDALLIGQTAESTRVAWDFINQNSPIHELSRWRQPKPSARTLISAVPHESREESEAMKQNAFLCWQPIGRGRVVYFSGPDTFRLRYLRGDALHYRFWGQLLRWAIASDLSAGTEFVRVRTEKTRYNSREVVRAFVRLADAEGAPMPSEKISLTVTADDREQSVPLVADPDVPGGYQGEIGTLEPGVYRIQPGGLVIDQLQSETEIEPAFCSVTVQADTPRELVDTRCDRALASQIAGITGGQVVPPTAVEEVLGLTDLEPIVTKKAQRKPLWTRWRYLWIVFGCLQIEWIIRKWKGLS